jgi:hypothetical protein
MGNEMYKLPKNLQIINDRELVTVIQTVYTQAERHLSLPLHVHYTDHTIKHSVRVLECIDELIEGMVDPLNNEEKFILICGVLLHDIGMNSPRQYLGGIFAKHPLQEKELEKLREVHHILSKQIIIQSVSPNSEIKFGLEYNEKTKRMVYHIACVAEHHRILNIDQVEERGVGNAAIRLKLLCSLLRLCDCLDVDFERVDMEQLIRFEIEPKSKFFWYGHHYITACDLADRKVRLTFDFPEKYQENQSYVDIIVEHKKTEIEKHIEDVYKHLDKNQLRMQKEVECYIVFSNITKEMPPDLLQYIEHLRELENKTKIGQELDLLQYIEHLRREAHTNPAGFGEIDFYWGGDRKQANTNIRKYLTRTESNNIFIAAIGFGTLNSILEKNEVISHFQELILKSVDTPNQEEQFKITFVVPKNIADIKKFRPELSDETVRESNERGQKLLNLFRQKLANACFPRIRSEKEKLKKIAKYVEIREYNKENSIPRHFILYGSDNTIFVGSYLGWTTGKKSYIMKLKPYNKPPRKHDRYSKGLFELFTNEITHIKNCSTIRDENMEVL